MLPIGNLKCVYSSRWLAALGSYIFLSSDEQFLHSIPSYRDPSVLVLVNRLSRSAFPAYHQSEWLLTPCLRGILELHWVS